MDTSIFTFNPFLSSVKKPTNYMTLPYVYFKPEKAIIDQEMTQKFLENSEFFKKISKNCGNFFFY